MRWIRAAFVLTTILAAAAPVGAQPAVLQWIPDDAVGFALVNRVGQTNEKLTALAKKMKIELPASLLEMAKGALGADKGLAEKGSVAIAAFEGKNEGDEPRGLVYIPVTDYKTFLDQLQPGELRNGISPITLKDGKTMLAGKRGDFAILCDTHNRVVLERALKAETNLSSWAEPIQGWLVDNDVAGLLTERGIKLVTTEIDKGINAAKQNLGNLPPEAQIVGGFFEAADRFFKAAAKDVTHAGIGGRLDEAGNFHLSMRAEFRKDSGFAKAGSGIKAAPGGPVAGLPSGPFVFAVGGVVPENVLQSIMNMNMEMLKATAPDAPAEKLKKLDDLYAQMSKGVNGMSILWLVGKENQPVFTGMALAMQMEDAAKYMAEYEKNLAAINDAIKDLNVPLLPPYDVKKVKVADKDALEMSMDFTKGLGLPEGAGDIVKNMFGPDGKLTVSLAVRDSKTIIMRYTKAEGLKGLLNGEDPGFGSDAGVAKVTKLLPPGSQWAFYLSPKGTLDFAGNMIKAFSPIPLQIPRFPATPPIATGFRMSPQRVEVHTVVPLEVLDNVGDFVEKLKRIFDGTI